MERGDVRGGRIAASIAHATGGPGNWDGAGGDVIPFVKRDVHLRGAAGGPEGTSGGGSAGGVAIIRAPDRGVIQRPDGAVADGDGERDGDNRSARVLRDGEKRRVSGVGGEGRSAMAYTGAGDCRAGN